MIKLHHTLELHHLKSKMILQVHDELVFDVPKDEVDVMKALVKECMEHALEVGVPIDVEVGVGENWLDAH
ncbi:MAG: DNA polymerase, partial [Flavobacteriia bacterium]